ncbi:hypothetical protein INT45_003677 [Circinella minor]|uniref:Enkurin domain-containing protein n=1 Tax=Circinella minor TaxID=1195481 RepID=A0A8H7S352_9FUNG|nr:hypothetical protein INT45_003677 [Circinella minor]
MSSTIKSKDKTSAGQKFWHLKKLALGNKSNTNDQAPQRPPSPADTDSLCDKDISKPKSKRLSVLLSNRRQGNNGKVSPTKTLPSAMSAQNLHVLSSSNNNGLLSKTDNNNNNAVATNVRSAAASGTRQRTMSHTVGATAANDTRAAFLKSRQAENSGGHGLTRHASVRDMKSRATSSGVGDNRLRSASPPMCSKPNATEETLIDPAIHPILTKKRSSLPTDSSNKPSHHADDRTNTRRALRPASSFASLRVRRSQQQLQQQDDSARSTDEWSFHQINKNTVCAASPPPTPTSPRLGRSNTMQNLSQPGSPRTPTRPSAPRSRGSLPPTFGTASQNNNSNNKNPNTSDEEMFSSTEELAWSRSSDEDGTVVINNKDEDGDSMDLSSDSDHNSKRSEAYWRSKLDKERAVVKALQRQKEACNKDITFLSQSVDELTNEKHVLSTKYELEKTSRQRFQDDLSSVTDKLNEATKQVRQLVIEKSELEKVMNERRLIHEKALNEHISKLGKEKCSENLSDENLQTQLRHSQDQVRVLKATMEQFLRMGIFSDDMSMWGDIASRYNTTMKASAFESLVQDGPKPHQQQQQQGSKLVAATTQASSENTKKEDSALPEIKSVADLDNSLRELLREKELLQSEYSKIPITGVNALTRRRKEELEARLDQVDSRMSKIKLKHRDLLKK